MRIWPRPSLAGSAASQSCSHISSYPRSRSCAGCPARIGSRGRLLGTRITVAIRALERARIPVVCLAGRWLRFMPEGYALTAGLTPG